MATNAPILTPVKAVRLTLFVLFAIALGAATFSCVSGGQFGDGTPSVVSAPRVGVSAAMSGSPMTGSAVATGDPDMAAAKKMGLAYHVAPGQNRTQAEVDKLDSSCIACHGEYGGPDNHAMHAGNDVLVSCVDCHGGTADVAVPKGIKRSTNIIQYELIKAQAHVQPRQATRALWMKSNKLSSANPQIPGAATLNESLDYIRFVNPGDLHVARAACGACHNKEDYGYVVDRVERSMMATGPMLWEAALYNNGTINRKNAIYGESYAPGMGKGGMQVLLPVKLFASAKPSEIPTAQDTLKHGWLATLTPLPRYEISQPGNILRVFERGGEIRPALGLPETEELAGHPDVKLSLRGFGTDLRTDPVFLGLQKTRLLDPTLNLFGTNDHAGDYRASGCTACHVVYGNDTSPVHSGAYAKYGNTGRRATDGSDKVLPYSESGHPLHHVFAPGNSIPTSSCIVCHIHPGTNVVNAYLGFTWWDNEIDGSHMYPAKQKYPTSDQEAAVNAHNPEGSAPRGLWSNLYPGEKAHDGDRAPDDFLAATGSADFNKKLTHTQFADFHGHGWVFRAVFKRDRAGNMLDADGKPVTDVTAAKMKQGIDFADSTPGTQPPAGVPVHLKDIHLQMGMHCVDCHFEQDMHGDGKLYGETRNAVSETCADCHGTTDKRAAMLEYFTEDQKKVDTDDDNAVADHQKKLTALMSHLFTGNAAGNASADMNRRILKKFGLDDAGNLVQKGQLPDKDGKAVTWVVKQAAQTADTAALADKNSPTARALYAHTIRQDGTTWGSSPTDDDVQKNPSLALAHGNSKMSCYACHTSWNTSCFGCHLPMKANARKPVLHNEGETTRNYTNYNFQSIRDDVYMLGHDSSVKGGQIVPVRSACAVLVSSQDANRQWLYTQQQTISAEGYAGTAFSPYFPHTVRTTETKKCADCHLSKENDNNAIMSQLLMQGTKSVNFIGRFAWVACGHEGLQAVAVTERDEPQAVIGSRLHEWAYPDFFKAHLARGSQLKEAYEKEDFQVNDVQLRGEYCYAACGKDGFVAFDVSNIDNKGFSERITTAPVSPLGQRLYVRTPNATSVCSPSTLAIDPTRPHLPENQEQAGDPKTAIAAMYAYIYVTDSVDGLVVVGNKAGDPNGVGVSTLLDGNPDNNFLSKAVSFNPGGRLNGARHMRLLGHYAYVSCDSGMVVVDLNDPLHPQIVETPGLAGIHHPKKIFFQFRYGFVCDEDGLKVIDVTLPDKPTLVSGATLAIADARDIYVARTYGYVAAGKGGMLIVDLEKPEQPKLVDTVKDGLVDTTAVRVGMTNSSLYAYVADGVGGLHVFQLTSSDDQDGTPTFLGFSPLPKPRHIAHFETRGPAVSLSEGLDRDRAVDESGNQLAVFGRRGARPFTLAEMQRLYLKPDASGNPVPYRVGDVPDNQPATAPAAAPADKPKDE